VHPAILCLAEVKLWKNLLVHCLDVYDVREVGVPLEGSTLLAICDVIEADNLRRDVELLELCFITAFAVATREVDQDGVCLVWSTWSGRTCEKLSQFSNRKWHACLRGVAHGQHWRGHPER
jgi:hypothetical protein